MIWIGGPGKPATPKLVSTGKGRTTCSYFFPAGDRILFSSTHATSPDCPPKPDYSHGYVWPIYSSYQIYIDFLLAKFKYASLVALGELCRN